MKLLTQNHHSFKWLSLATIIKLLLVAALIVFCFTIIPNAAAQYTEVTRLGTSQAICKPGINTPAELQDFFSNNASLINGLLADSSWGGDSQQLFDAVASGDFTEKQYSPGSTFEWMAMRKGTEPNKGQPQVEANRVWAGKQAFTGYEVNLVNACVSYQLVIPKVCCNLSLAAATPITDSPTLNIESDGSTLKVCSDSDASVTLTGPDGASFGLALDDNACWSDSTLAPGTYTAEANSECGSTTQSAAITAPTAPATSDVRKWIPFIAGTVGTETLMRYEQEWDMEVRDSSGMFGVRAGVKAPIGQSLFIVPAIGVFHRNGINNNNVYPDNGVNLDLGIEKFINERFFIGIGAGLWDVDDSDYREESIFIKTGGTITDRTEWFVEARGIDSDNPDGDDGFSDNHAFNGGVRFLF